MLEIPDIVAVASLLLLPLSLIHADFIPDPCIKYHKNTHALTGLNKLTGANISTHSGP